ncbi:MAG TPA: 4'-phosphopantetheinyl transferase superfamily protein [Bacteroidaceae bacterium]|nr:4'-phosphopantetheinyl transferase superfamily protein [Bacteroidaceae bacterium]
MPLHDLFSVSDGKIGVWKIEESISELLLLTSYREDYNTMLKKYGSEKRKLEKLAIRVLLKLMTGNDKLTIIYDSNGKPYLEDTNNNISISHTAGYAALFINSTNLVGLDIERRERKIYDLAPKFLNDEELMVIDKNRRNDALLLCWSGKESVYKIVGEPALNFRDTLFVKPFIVSDSGSFFIIFKSGDTEQLFNLEYQLQSDYLLTWSKRDRLHLKCTF